MRQCRRARQMDWFGTKCAQPGVPSCGGQGYATATPRLVHDGASQVMGPVGGVVVGPDAGVNLGDDDLRVGSAELVDFLGEQGGRVNAVGADFDFLGAVARD